MFGCSHGLLKLAATAAVDCQLHVVIVKLEPHWRIGASGWRDFNHANFTISDPRQ
jgi:hypothetical protein